MLDGTLYRLSVTSIFFNSGDELWAPTMSQFYAKFITIISNPCHHTDRWENGAPWSWISAELAQLEYGNVRIWTHISLSPKAHIPSPVPSASQRNTSMACSDEYQGRTRFYSFHQWAGKIVNQTWIYYVHSCRNFTNVDDRDGALW